MAEIEVYLKRLDQLYSTVGSRRNRIPQQRLDKEFNPVFERLCAAYGDASAEQRVDTYICFEARDNLLNALTLYAGDTADRARNLAITSKWDKAIPILKRAVAADSIVDGRGSDELISRSQQLLLNAVEDSDFNLKRYAAQLDLTAKDFANRALQLHKEAQNLNAAKAVGLALQMDTATEPDPRLVELAKTLTGKPAHAALATLREPFQREKFVSEAAVHHLSNRGGSSDGLSSQRRFWIITIAGALLPSLIALVIFAGSINPKDANNPDYFGLSIFSGLLIGVAFVVYRIKLRD
jgi:hypothetical protein